MTTLPSLRQLSYLVALADERHFGRAAEACHVTQSTLSAGIKELENTLQASLAERTKRTVMLTPLGQEVAAAARRILADAEALVERVAASGEPLAGDLNLGLIPTIGPFLLPRVLPALRQRYPKLRLYLREEQTASLLDGLAEGRLDAVVMAFPYPTEGVTIRPLFEDPFYLACPAGHPLAARAMVSDVDLLGEPLMLLEEGHCMRGHALAACKMTERGHGREFEATSLQTLVPMVAAGLGLTLLPKLAVDAGIAEVEGLTLVPFAPGSAEREVALVWRRTSARGTEFELLAEMLAPGDA